MNLHQSYRQAEHSAIEDEWLAIPGPLDRAQPGAINRVFRAAVITAAVWSLVESPWEIGDFGTTSELSALAVTKLMIAALAFWAVRRQGWPRLCFVFLCSVSALEITSALPSELAVSREIFCLSAIECVTKLLVVVTHFFPRPGG